MIICYIDNKKAYPNTSDKIKVTYENQFIKDSGSYTYEISFPMSVPENRELFNNINRFDVKKKSGSFENCSLMVDNRLIITGKGHITSVTADAVKLQIAGGKSRIKYNSAFERRFIDEIKYPEIRITHGYNKRVLADSKLAPEQHATLPIDLTTFNYVGQKDVVAFNPINDETNEWTINQITSTNFVNYGAVAEMSHLAAQPFLMYVIKQVLQHEGYNLTRNDFDCNPWNRLIIANAHQTLKIAEALPHWTVYKFLDEVRKLFNASFIFDEQAKTVQILSQNELVSNKTVSYDCDDEYSSEFDEDGLENIATSNIAYNFVDSVNRSSLELIPIEILRKYPLKEYPDYERMEKDCEAMRERDRFTTIFKTDGDYYIYSALKHGAGHELVKCGLFSPLIRDINNDNKIGLNIIPVAMYARKRMLDKEKKYIKNKFDRIPHDAIIYIPSISNEKDNGEDNMTKDEESGDYYLSVENALTNGVDKTKETTNDEKMVVMFQGQYVKGCGVYSSMYPYTAELPEEDVTFRYPVVFVDSKYTYGGTYEESGSLSLNRLPHESLGSMHKATNIDSNNKLCIKFYTDDIPDPSKIYNFRNKLFICEKVELEIDSQGIAKQKTGYFYEYV